MNVYIIILIIAAIYYCWYVYIFIYKPGKGRKNENGQSVVDPPHNPLQQTNPFLDEKINSKNVQNIPKRHKFAQVVIPPVNENASSGPLSEEKIIQEGGENKEFFENSPEIDPVLPPISDEELEAANDAESLIDLEPSIESEISFDDKKDEERLDFGFSPYNEEKASNKKDNKGFNKINDQDYDLSDFFN